MRLGAREDVQEPVMKNTDQDNTGRIGRSFF